MLFFYAHSTDSVSDLRDEFDYLNINVTPKITAKNPPTPKIISFILFLFVFFLTLFLSEQFSNDYASTTNDLDEDEYTLQKYS